MARFAAVSIISGIIATISCGGIAVGQHIDDILVDDAFEACRVALAHTEEAPEKETEREARIVSIDRTSFRKFPAKRLQIEISYRDQEQPNLRNLGECTVVWPYVPLENGLIDVFAYPVFERVTWLGSDFDPMLLQSVAHRITDLIEVK